MVIGEKVVGVLGKVCGNNEQESANKILYSILEKSYIMNNKYNFKYCYFITFYLIMMIH